MAQVLPLRIPDAVYNLPRGMILFRDDGEHCGELQFPVEFRIYHLETEAGEQRIAEAKGFDGFYAVGGTHDLAMYLLAQKIKAF